jgi:hypothetical protein
MAWPPVTPLAEVSTGTAISPITKMARKPDAILMVIARLPRTALLLQAARVLLSGKPTMDSRGILLALDLENSKRPCADYGGGSDERCKYYSHGTLTNEMARLCCAGSNRLAIFVLKLREFASSRPCDRPINRGCAGGYAIAPSLEGG